MAEEEITYRCPECDTYSGTFTLSLEDEEGKWIVHSLCGREAVEAAFIPGTPEANAIYEGTSDPSDPWDADEIDFDDVPTGEVSNTRRAEAGESAIAAFSEDMGMEGEDRETILTDLLTDLHHWADAAGLDWARISERAEGHHATEVTDVT